VTYLTPTRNQSGVPTFYAPHVLELVASLS
jgi:hypothetical protein